MAKLLTLIPLAAVLFLNLACSSKDDDEDDCVEPTGPSMEESCSCIEDETNQGLCDAVWDACDDAGGRDAADCKTALAELYACEWEEPDNVCEEVDPTPGSTGLSMEETCGCLDAESAEDGICEAAWDACDDAGGMDGRECKIELQTVFECD